MYYQRNLPHWQPENAEFFITFRLSNSLPRSTIQHIKTQKRILEKKLENRPLDNDSSDKLSELRNYHQTIFKKYEDQLDGAKTGPTWLNKQKVADIVCKAIHFRDNSVYDLYAYCIMPNHVHLVLKMLQKNNNNATPALTKVLQNLKSYTALKCNRILNRTGSFWQAESFDRVIRDEEELESTIRYVLNNPVKANLVDSWTAWPYSFCKSDFKNDF
ncbi:REP-associated tyrosine transposase [Fodinibius sp.]|uniref:REP-associated tyrosine transposase n=1 Tax=Fodinibius sp. TaxID=1872440 RepID=UPI002ACEA710|nr:transposase [Fodinibius sp.]MDZ7658681.1 transposase [Fodinibius sp.]